MSTSKDQLLAWSCQFTRAQTHKAIEMVRSGHVLRSNGRDESGMLPGTRSVGVRHARFHVYVWIGFFGTRVGESLYPQHIQSRGCESKSQTSSLQRKKAPQKSKERAQRGPLHV